MTDQHQKVGADKLQEMQDGADSLLPGIGPEGRNGVAIVIANSVLAAQRAGLARPRVVCNVLLDQIAIVLLDRPAQELEHHAEEEDTDAGAGEHALRPDAPPVGEEAGIDGVGIEQHLVDESAPGQ